MGALRARRPGAAEALFDRYGRHVRRVLLRVLGPDPELLDLLHDVFVTAMESIDRLQSADRLKDWITSIAIFTARARIRSRQRYRGVFTLSGEALETAGPFPRPELSEIVREVYDVLDRMPDKERIVFALRCLDGMEIGEIAGVLDVSHATAKRRVARARARFERLAERRPALRDYVAGGPS